MSNDLNPPEIFDRGRRRAMRDKAAGRTGDMFLWNHIAQDLAERLSAVTRPFENAMVLGPIGRWHEHILPPNVRCQVITLSQTETDSAGLNALEEDRLPFTPGSFDLVISAGTLDSVNDLPGALIQIRRILKPDGLFLGHLFGAGTLATLKSMFLETEADRATAHIHPQIDLRSAADLLVRAGFNLPVADQDMTFIRYGDWRSLISDIRDAGIGNALAGPRPYLGKDISNRLDNLFAARADEEGKVTECFTHLHLSGWAPSESQRRPAKRGSAQVSLAEVLSKHRAD
ncbi:methyltransferase domain-containing protein [Sphingorhabdus sp.]|uniref:methyltransferase domain-containing protein n=1 Tax=Sphingorhabdus sp. TaxID=1902408 RepID=UPI00391D729F